MNISIIIQARMGSTRLPGKVLKDINGKPMLWHLVNRVKKVKAINNIIIATTDKDIDRHIIKFAEDLGIDSFAGNEYDVLDRYYRAANKFSIDVIGRITADCPLMDPRIIDKVADRYLKGDADYVANIVKTTYPDGLDVEFFSYDALEKAWKEAKWTSEREHVTPYIRNNPDRFRIVNVENDMDLSYLRWTVDQKEDLKLIRMIYKYLYKENEIFYMEDILDLFNRYPRLRKTNQGIAPNEGYTKSLQGDKII